MGKEVSVGETTDREVSIGRRRERTFHTGRQYKKKYVTLQNLAHIKRAHRESRTFRRREPDRGGMACAHAGGSRSKHWNSSGYTTTCVPNSGAVPILTAEPGALVIPDETFFYFFL